MGLAKGLYNLEREAYHNLVEDMADIAETDYLRLMVKENLTLDAALEFFHTPLPLYEGKTPRDLFLKNDIGPVLAQFDDRAYEIVQ